MHGGVVDQRTAECRLPRPGCSGGSGRPDMAALLVARQLDRILDGQPAAMWPGTEPLRTAGPRTGRADDSRFCWVRLRAPMCRPFFVLKPCPDPGAGRSSRANGANRNAVGGGEAFEAPALMRRQALALRDADDSTSWPATNGRRRCASASSASSRRGKSTTRLRLPGHAESDALRLGDVLGLAFRASERAVAVAVASRRPTTGALPAEGRYRHVRPSAWKQAGHSDFLRSRPCDDQTPKQRHSGPSSACSLKIMRARLGEASRIADGGDAAGSKASRTYSAAGGRLRPA